jgi:hypothetical protein
MSKADPYHDHKIYHLARFINVQGGVSPWCYAKPRSLNLARALWTNRLEAVTCPKCLKAKAEAA